MIRVPGEKPIVPPITPKEVKPEKGPEEKLTPRPTAPLLKHPGIGRGPEMDAHAVATRLAVLAAEAKEKELKFEDIIDRVIQETGLTNAQAAMEEANRKLQKEIEEELEKIKANKELMEEAQSWEHFAELLSEMSPDQVKSFLSLLRNEIRALA